MLNMTQAEYFNIIQSGAFQKLKIILIDIYVKSFIKKFVKKKNQ